MLRMLVLALLAATASSFVLRPLSPVVLQRRALGLRVFEGEAEAEAGTAEDAGEPKPLEINSVEDWVEARVQWEKDNTDLTAGVAGRAGELCPLLSPLAYRLLTPPAPATSRVCAVLRRRHWLLRGRPRLQSLACEGRKSRESVSPEES